MFQFKKLMFSIVLIVLTLNNANAITLKESTKPSKMTVYIEENLPFSGFNSELKAQGVFVDYWNKWSQATGISVEFKPYAKQHLERLLNTQQPAIYSGFNLSEEDKKQLDKVAFIGLSSEYYWLPKNTHLLEKSLIGKSESIVVGGLLSQARQLPSIRNNEHIIYKKYEGTLEMLIDLYLGKIDTFVIFKVADAKSSLIQRVLEQLLSSTTLNTSNNEFYAYSTQQQKSLLEWVKWGTGLEALNDQLKPLLNNMTASEWGVSDKMERYLLILLLLFLFFILNKHFKRKKNQQFKGLLDSSPYPLVICSLDGKLIFYTNDEAGALFPFKKTRKSFIFGDPENQLLLSRFMNKVSHQSVIETGLLRLLVGSKFHNIEISAKRIHHQQESAWLCYLKDVTELLKAQRSLNEERELLRKVLDSIPEQINFKSPKGEVIGCNEAWAKVNNTSVLKATGRNEVEIEGPKKVQQAQLQESSVWAGDTFNTQEWVEHKNKQLCLMNITKVPLYNDKGAVFSILSVASDITAIYNLNKQLKDESLQRKETEKALSKQHTLLKSIFDATEDPIGLLDEKGVILGANKSFTHFMGSSLDDITGLSQHVLLPYERSDWSDRQNKEVIELGKPITFEEFVFFEGEETWYEVHKAPFIDEVSDSRGIVVMARDITDRKNKELKLTNEASVFEQRSLHDQLTKMHNRRAFDETIAEYWKSACKQSTPLSLIMCDIDFFKAYNDHYGHQKGDEALQQVASILLRKCEEYGCFAARYGGEEFVILIKDKSATHVLRIAEDIRKSVEQERIEHAELSVVKFVTMSLGMATYLPHDGVNATGLIKEADNALYLAKSTGRNQVQVA